MKQCGGKRRVYYFDDTGGLTKTLLGNSSYTEYLYNGAGNLTLLSNKKSDATVVSAFAYGVDDTGNRTKMSISGSAYTSADVAYTYDDAYQLTGEVRTGGNAYSQYFYYDPNGNRTKSTLGGADTTHLYNTGDQLTSETAGGTTTTYLYDANGALTKSDDGTTVNAYTYDYDGYQTAFDTTGTSNDATYTYDADKRRIDKVVDSVTTKYFLDPDTSGRKRRAGSANVIADYDADNALAATYVTPGLDSNLSQTRSGSTYYYMKDGLGSVRNLVDSSEATQNTYDYYAFGKELGTWTQGVTNRYTYTAREYDAEAKQYYYRARYYAGEGRFVQRDPAHSGTSAYIYARNIPTLLTDATGLIPGTQEFTTCCGPRSAMKTVKVGVKQLVGNSANPVAEVGRADAIYEQCCIQVKLRGVEKLGVRDTLKLIGAGDPQAYDIGLEDAALASAAVGGIIMTAFYVNAIVDPADPVGPNVRITGYADIGNNALALAVGAISSTLAHEMGHILLNTPLGGHTADPNNLMFPYDRVGGTMPRGARLTPTQCRVMRTSPLVR